MALGCSGAWHEQWEMEEKDADGIGGGEKEQIISVPITTVESH